MSCAVMRTRLPALATLPSRTAPTLSCEPIVRTSSFLPLKANDEVRAATRRPDTLDSAVIKSSEMPSLKYSFSLSELMLTKGNTATDFFCGGDPGEGLALCGARAARHHPPSATAARARARPAPITRDIGRRPARFGARGVHGRITR